ncbi:MAG: TMEM175 family protein [Candidatus Elarobacter sp.]
MSRAQDVMDRSRFDALTDGVFAVAITLMVLEFRVPDLKDATDPDRAMRAFLGSLGGPLLTYALSFATVGVIWLNHHATFAPLRNINRSVNALNLVLLATVCFVPFPTALLSRYGPLPSSTAFYGATFTALSLAYFAVWQYAVRSDPEAPPIPLSVVASGSIGTLFYLLGTGLAFVAPKLSIGIFVAVTVYYSLPGLFNRRQPVAVERKRR